MKVKILFFRKNCDKFRHLIGGGGGGEGGGGQRVRDEKREREGGGGGGGGVKEIVYGMRQTTSFIT